MLGEVKLMDTEVDQWNSLPSSGQLKANNDPGGNCDQKKQVAQGSAAPKLRRVVDGVQSTLIK
jgi:hypothetical protein